MKNLLLAIAVLLSLNSFAQSPYNAQIKFPMSDTTDEVGGVYKRNGFFISMTYNQNEPAVRIEVQVKLYNNTTELRRFAKPYVRFFTIDNNTFVVSATGAVIGDRNAMRLLYGVVLTPAVGNVPATYRQSVFGGDSLTTPCMGQYTYLTSTFDNNVKLHQTIKQLCVAAAAEGKLNEE